MRLLWGLAVLAACGGDPRTNFVGSYRGVVTETISLSSGPRVEEFDADFTITAPARSDRLQFSTRRMFTAEALDAETIQIDPLLCSLGRLTTSTSGVTADFTDDYSGGAGKLTNKTLTLTIQGTEIGSNYSNGTPTQRWGILVKMSVMKQ
jgi:Ca2+-binding RTX toxin-like protein